MAISKGCDCDKPLWRILLVSHLVENSYERISCKEFLKQEITDYVFLRRHAKQVPVILIDRWQSDHILTN